MANKPTSYKQTVHTPRVINREAPYIGGMHYTDTPLGTSIGRVLINFENKQDNTGITPRKGAKVTTAWQLTELPSSNELPNNRLYFADTIYRVADDGITHRFIRTVSGPFYSLYDSNLQEIAQEPILITRMKVDPNPEHDIKIIPTVKNDRLVCTTGFETNTFIYIASKTVDSANHYDLYQINSELLKSSPVNFVTGEEYAKVYFDTSLSVDEVAELLADLTYSEGTCVLFQINNKLQLVALTDGINYMLVFSSLVGEGHDTYIFSTATDTSETPEYTKGWQNLTKTGSYTSVYSIPTSEQGALDAVENIDCMSAETFTPKAVVEQIAPTEISLTQATTWGYNMLSDTPYAFESTTGGSSFVFEGVLPKKDGKTVANLIIGTSYTLQHILKIPSGTYAVGLSYKNSTQDTFSWTDATGTNLTQANNYFVYDLNATGLKDHTFKFNATTEDTILRFKYYKLNAKTLCDHEVDITIKPSDQEKDYSEQIVFHNDSYGNSLYYEVSGIGEDAIWVITYYPEAENDDEKELFAKGYRPLTTAPVFLNFAKDANAVSELKTYVIGTASGVCYWRHRLVAWGVKDAENILFVSDIDNPGYFPYPNNISTFEDSIQHVVPFQDDLLVFTSSQIWRVVLDTDGLTWTQTCIQRNLHIDPKETAQTLVLSTMVFFKSGDLYYLLVPSAKGTGDLVVANISSTMVNVFKNPLLFMRKTIKKLYNKETRILDNPNSSIPIDEFVLSYPTDVGGAPSDGRVYFTHTYLDYHKLHVVYTTSCYYNNQNNKACFNLVFTYDTDNRIWTSWTFETPTTPRLIEQDNLKSSTWMCTLSSSGFLKRQTTRTTMTVPIEVPTDSYYVISTPRKRATVLGYHFREHFHEDIFHNRLYFESNPSTSITWATDTEIARYEGSRGYSTLDLNYYIMQTFVFNDTDLTDNLIRIHTSLPEEIETEAAYTDTDSAIMKTVLNKRKVTSLSISRIAKREQPSSIYDKDVTLFASNMYLNYTADPKTYPSAQGIDSAIPLSNPGNGVSTIQYIPTNYPGVYYCVALENIRDHVVLLTPATEMLNYLTNLKDYESDADSINYDIAPSITGICAALKYYTTAKIYGLVVKANTETDVTPSELNTEVSKPMYFPNYQYIDTGNRNIEPSINKRMREYKINVANHTPTPIRFKVAYIIDKTIQRPLYPGYTIPTADPTTVSEREYRLSILNDEGASNPDELYEDQYEAIIEDKDLEFVVAGLTNWAAPVITKLMAPITSKGYTPQLQILSQNQTSYEITSIEWVYRYKNAR